MEYQFKIDDIKNHILTKLKYDNNMVESEIKKWFILNCCEKKYHFNKDDNKPELLFSIDEFESIMCNGGIYDIINNDDKNGYNILLLSIDKKKKRYEDIVKNLDIFETTYEIYNFLTLEELYYIGL